MFEITAVFNELFKEFSRQCAIYIPRVPYFAFTLEIKNSYGNK